MTARTIDAAPRAVDSARRAWTSLRLRDAVLISLVPLAVIFYLTGAAIATYRRAQAFDDFYSRGVTVAGAYRQRLHAGWVAPAVVTLRQAFDVRDDDPTIVRLSLEGEAWDSLQSPDVGDWTIPYRAMLQDGGVSTEVRVRKRGDTSVHWLTEKRSIAVRTPQDQLFRGYRNFGLSAKEPFTSYVVNQLATSFGLMLPTTTLAPVFVNNKYYGIFRFIAPPDEAFLETSGRLPGNIFRGDRAERGEYYPGQPRNLFANPAIWDRAADQAVDGPADPAQLRLLIDDLAGARLDDARRLASRFDREELARFFAYLFVAGDPYHMDGVHNQLLYEDPATQRLHPIPWDTRLLDLGRPQPLNDLYAALLRDPFLVDAVTRWLADAVKPDGARADIERIIDAAETRYGRYLRYDRMRGRVIGDVGERAELLRGFDHNLDVIGRWLADDSVAWNIAPAGADLVIDLETRGHTGADLAALAPLPSGARLFRDANRNGVRDAGDTEIPLAPAEAGSGRRALERPEPLLAGWTTTRGGVAGHIAYRFFLAGASARPTLELRNRVSGQPATLVAWTPGEAIRPATAWHPWDYPAPPAPRVHRLAGPVRLAETLRIPAGDSLIIAPGTSLRLAPDVSIVAAGAVIMRGTAAQPIRVTGDGAQPWGTIALTGAGARGSRLAHVEFSGGVGATVDRVHYPGMLAVYGADSVTLDSLVLRDNPRGEDQLRILSSDGITLRGSRFLRAALDAIDFELSSGTIEGVRIEHAGKDGIDMRGSAPRIVDAVITGARDKGISAGEGSAPVIVNTLITRSITGLESKDRSAPLLVHSEFDSNGVAIVEAVRNWRYGGGPWTTLVATRFRRNRLVHDPAGRQTLLGNADVNHGEETSPAADRTAPEWLYASLGIAPAGDSAGLLRSWRPVTAWVALDQGRFTDDFTSSTDGWTAGGGTQRLEKRDDVLAFEVERYEGSAARAAPWTLTTAGTLVIEVAGRDIGEGKVAAVTEDGRVIEQAFHVSPEPFIFRYVTLALPAGRYRELRVAASPVPGLSRSVQRTTGLSVLRAGRLWLRSWAVYARPGV